MIKRTNKQCTFNQLLAIAVFFITFVYMFLWELRIVVFTWACLLLIGFLSLLSLIASRKVRINKTVLLLFFLLLVNVLGLGISPPDTIESAIKWCLSLLVALLFFLFSLSGFNKKYVIIFFLFFCLVSVLGVYLNVLYPSGLSMINSVLLKSSSFENFQILNSYGYYSGFSGFNNIPGFWGGVAAVIFLSRYLGDQEKRRVLNLILVFVCFFAVVLTQKRGILIASGLVIILIVVMKQLINHKFKALVKIFVFLIVAGVIVYYIMTQTEAGKLMMARFLNSDDVSSGRIGIYQNLLSGWEGFFLLGNGPASTKALLNTDAHNIFLQVFFENGIVGVMLLVALVLTNLYSSIKLFKAKYRNEKKYDNFILSSIGIQLLFFFYGFFGNPFSDLNFFLTYLLFVSFSAPINCFDKEEKLVEKNKINSLGCHISIHY